MFGRRNGKQNDERSRVSCEKTNVSRGIMGERVYYGEEKRQPGGGSKPGPGHKEAGGNNNPEGEGFGGQIQTDGSHLEAVHGLYIKHELLIFLGPNELGPFRLPGYYPCPESFLVFPAPVKSRQQWLLLLDGRKIPIRSFADIIRVREQCSLEPTLLSVACCSFQLELQSLTSISL